MSKDHASEEQRRCTKVLSIFSINTTHAPVLAILINLAGSSINIVVRKMSPLKEHSDHRDNLV